MLEQLLLPGLLYSVVGRDLSFLADPHILLVATLMTLTGAFGAIAGVRYISRHLEALMVTTRIRPEKALDWHFKTIAFYFSICA